MMHPNEATLELDWQLRPVAECERAPSVHRNFFTDSKLDLDSCGGGS